MINPLISLDGTYAAVFHLKNGDIKSTKSSDKAPTVIPEVISAQ